MITDYKDTAKRLMDEWDSCMKAKPKNPSVDVTLERDNCAPFAYQVNTLYAWGDDDDKLADACHQLEARLCRLKEKLIFEVLKNGV